jgi:pyruvate dehydrogenase E2 component (dihydrolipoamide acetyltransferase)
MATNILMPALSPTMTEGTLARWLKKEGDTIRAGDVIAEIETDKATMEVEAVDEGVLGRILVPDGTEGVAVNAPIAVLVDKGEAVPAGPAASTPVPAPVVAAPVAAPPVAAQAAQPAPVAAQPAVVAAPVAAAGDRVVASPLAKRMAQQAGLSLAGLAGSGPGGRIIKADVEAALSRPAPAVAAGPAPVAAAAKPVAASSIAAPHRLVPHSSMRKTIARRLTEAKSTIPHIYVSMDIEIDALLKLAADLTARSPKNKDGSPGEGAFFISVNDMVIKASARALRLVPGVNASWTDDGLVLYDNVDISVAVSIPDGLITPIIRNADRKGLAEISLEMRELAGRARQGKLKLDEFQGGGFSISNMGMYGVSSFSAIINPPQAAILAVGAGAKRPVVKDGALAIATVMTCTLSADHRAIDGALAAQFMSTLKKVIEDPISVML